MRVSPVPRIRGRRFRMRAWMAILVGVLVALFLSARGLAGFYTDYLWFDSIGFGSTWRGLLWARFVPAAVFTALFFALMLLSLTIADRLAPRTRGLGPEDEMLARYQATVAPYAGRLRVLVALIFALLAGTSVAGEWQRWILFTNSQDFGIKDPQFGMDLGFFVFRLPFLTFVLDWLFAGMIIVVIVTAVAHYLNGGIRLQAPFQRVTPQVKAHLSVLLALMALVKAAEYYLARYELDFSTRGFVQGAGKTDVAVRLPALTLLMVISVVAAGLFVWNIFRRGWVLPVIAVGLWGFVSLIIGTVVPAIYQQTVVKPNAQAKERPYIARNIKATRAAFGLTNVKTSNFQYSNNLTSQDLEENRQTISNARLWDPTVIQTNFQQFQSFQTYYRFGDADTDRYVIGNTLRQVMISARELNAADLPSQSWVNRHIAYTHGYGAVVSPANQADGTGQPNYELKNIPGTGTIALDQPELYFGEQLDGFSLVNAKQDEFNYATDGSNKTTRYKGTAGVDLSSWLRRAAFALRFGDQNLLISSQIEDRTRIIFRRDIRERVEASAPFLSFDDDPYPVIANGRMVWVLDGYTTSVHYPYAQSVTPSDGVLAGTRFNYIRNSVKATVDAYDGTITYYIVDSTDPMIKAYKSAFPEMFSAFGEMPKSVRSHLRYPQDLFRYQTDVYRKYHTTNPDTFFSGTPFWEVSAEPGAAAVGDLGSTVTNVPQDATSTSKRIDPIYVLSRLPGQTEEEFLIIRPFVPQSKGNSQNRLSAFMVARADPEAKHPLESFEMPAGLNVVGPVQVDRIINSTRAISEQFTFLNQQGSRIRQGSIQIIPVKDSLLYIQPVYLLSENGDQPAFSFVIVYYDGKAKFAATVQEALQQFPEFSGNTPPPDGGEQPPPTTPGASTVDELLNQANEAYAAIEKALEEQDLGAYQAKVKELGAILERLAAERSAEQDGTSNSSSSTSTTTRPASGSSAQAVGAAR